MRLISILCFIAFFGQCKTYVYRLESTLDKNEQNKVGLVAFAVYFEFPPDDFLESGNYYEFSGPMYNRIIKIDENTKVNAGKWTRTPEFKLIKETDDQKIYEGSFVNIFGYSALLVPADNAKYTISMGSYTFCRQGNCQEVTVYFDPEDSEKTITFSPKPGDINYLGVFKAVQVETNSDDPFALASTLFQITGLTKKKKFVLKRDDDFALKSKIKNITDYLYYPEKLKPGYDEFRFLDGLAKSFPDSYWSKVAENKLKKFPK